ncbi:hypothetical protein J6590_075337 [Homalodisca vitripennis]|nr:hypothetical protein J6590_075337 [Homalodisca vitripennis]
MPTPHRPDICPKHFTARLARDNGFICNPCKLPALADTANRLMPTPHRPDICQNTSQLPALADTANGLMPTPHRPDICPKHFTARLARDNGFISVIRPALADTANGLMPTPHRPDICQTLHSSSSSGQWIHLCNPCKQPALADTANGLMPTPIVLIFAQNTSQLV